MTSIGKLQREGVWTRLESEDGLMLTPIKVLMSIAHWNEHTDWNGLCIDE